MIDLGKSEVIEPVIEHLLHRIQRYGQEQESECVWGWLFVHGLEEGCSFELAMGTSPIDDMEELLQSEIWEYDTEMEDVDEDIGSYELNGVFEGYDLANNELTWSERPSLYFHGWTLTPTGECEWDCKGFDVEEDEAENIFIARVYRYILQQVVARCPKDIEGFVLEMHDSALPREWINLA